MRNILFAAAIGISSTLLAMGGAQDEHLQLQGHGMKDMTMMDCPMKAADVDLSVEDTSDGIRLTFTTKSGDVLRIRRHVEAFSKIHSASATTDMRGNRMPFTSTYDVVPGGARITLTPRDPQKLEEFRAKVREHSVKHKDGKCAIGESMMPGRMGGMKNTPDPTSADPGANPDEPQHGSHRPPSGKQ